MKAPIHVDGGLKQYGIFADVRGQGYAKIVKNGERTEINLTSNDNTNIEAELFALLCGIIEAIKKPKRDRAVFSDSEWSIKAIKNHYKVKEDRLKLMIYSLSALTKFYEVELIFVPREQNLAT